MDAERTFCTSKNYGEDVTFNGSLSLCIRWAVFRGRNPRPFPLEEIKGGVED
jgi:hypothetical protein